MATINNLIWSTSPGTSGISFTGGNFSADVGKSIRVKSDGSGLEFFTPEYGDVTAVTGTTPIVVTNSGGPIPNVTINGLSGYGTANQLVQTTGSAWGYVTTVGTGAPVRTSGSTLVNTTFLGNTSAANLYTSGKVDVDQMNVRGGAIGIQFGGSGGPRIGRTSDNLYFTSTNDSTGLTMSSTGAISAPVSLTTPILTVTSNLSVTSTTLGFFGTTATTKKTVNVHSISSSVFNPVLNTEAFMAQIQSFSNSYRSLLAALGDETGYGLIDTTI